MATTAALLGARPWPITSGYHPEMSSSPAMSGLPDARWTALSP
jgi:hypothetical protein